MKVGTVRQGLAARLHEALESGDVETIVRVTDYVRAIGAALASYSGDDDVNLADLMVDSQQASQILGYHPEHVRRLLRQEALEAEKEGKAYRIPLTSVISALEGRVSGWVAPAVLKGLRALVPMWESPQRKPPRQEA